MRAQCPRFQPAALLLPGTAALLRGTREAIKTLVQMLDSTEVSVRQVAVFLRDTGLLAFEERFGRILNHVKEPRDAAAGAEAIEANPSDAPVMAFLSCHAHELWPYQRYVSDDSPFAPVP